MKKTSSIKGRKLYHWCKECENIVAKKKNEPFDLYPCKHDKDKWVRFYI